jgi:hypothetical protein
MRRVARNGRKRKPRADAKSERGCLSDRKARRTRNVAAGAGADFVSDA